MRSDWERTPRNDPAESKTKTRWVPEQKCSSSFVRGSLVLTETRGCFLDTLATSSAGASRAKPISRSVASSTSEVRRSAKLFLLLVLKSLMRTSQRSLWSRRPLKHWSALSHTGAQLTPESARVLQVWTIEQEESMTTGVLGGLAANKAPHVVSDKKLNTLALIAQPSPLLQSRPDSGDSGTNAGTDGAT